MANVQVYFINEAEPRSYTNVASLEDLQNKVLNDGKEWDNVINIVAEDNDIEIINQGNGERLVYNGNLLDYKKKISVQGIWMYYLGEGEISPFKQESIVQPNYNYIIDMPKSSFKKDNEGESYLDINAIYNKCNFKNMFFKVTINGVETKIPINGKITYNVVEDVHPSNSFVIETGKASWTEGQNNNYFQNSGAVYSGRNNRGMLFFIRDIYQPNEEYPEGYCQVLVTTLSVASSAPYLASNDKSLIHVPQSLDAGFPTWWGETKFGGCQFRLYYNGTTYYPWCFYLPFSSYYEYAYAKGLTDIYKKVSQSELDEFLRNN